LVYIHMYPLLSYVDVKKAVTPVTPVTDTSQTAYFCDGLKNEPVTTRHSSSQPTG
jgi:hypothetical protein